MQRIAVVGAGFMGRTHAEAYKRIEDARVVAVCDQNGALGVEFAGSYSCAAYTDIREFLEREEFEVLDICLPTFLHEEYALLGAKHGRHVFCEKPATLSLESFDRMTGAVERAGRRLLIGQVMRFWPEYDRTRRLLEEGVFGALKAVRAARISVHPNWSDWYRRAENSGGGLVDLHLHDVDYLCSLFGRPERVYAVGKQNGYGCWNHVASTLRFPGGVDATAEGIIEMQEGYPFTMELRVVGDAASMEYRLRAGVNLEDVAAAQRESLLFREGRAPEPLNAGTEDAYTLELRYFIRCLETGEAPERITPESVRTSLETVLAIRRSLESGGEIRM